MHSVRIEPAKLILVGTRITCQATGDAGTITFKWRFPPGKTFLETGTPTVAQARFLLEECILAYSYTVQDTL